MSKKLFHNRNINLDALVSDVEAWLKNNDCIIHVNKDTSAYTIQAKRRSSNRTIVGADRLFSIIITGGSDDFTVEIDIKEWILMNGGQIMVFGAAMPLKVMKNFFLNICAVRIELCFWKYIETWMVINSPNIDVETASAVKNKKGIKKNLRRLENTFKDFLLRFLEIICG